MSIFYVCLADGEYTFTIAEKDCKSPQDSDSCIADAWSDWGNFTCYESSIDTSWETYDDVESGWCTSWSQDMQRCCPESCGTGSLTETECNALDGSGTCVYPN